MIRKRQKKLGFYEFLLLCSICLSVVSCKSKSTQIVLKGDFFSINFPEKDSVFFVKGDDSRYGAIIWKGCEDTIKYRFGYVVNTLTEDDPQVIYLPIAKQDSGKVDTSNYILANDQFFDLDDYRKQNVFYTRINNYRAKITLPRERIVNGMTGVYFDSLREDAFGRLRFSLYAEGLSKNKQLILEKAIYSIRFDLDKLEKKKNFMRD